MIKIEHLTKNYGSNCAVDDICLEIERGETVGFLGPNGAGKSTTMNILTGCLSASAGRVSINDIDMMADPIGAKKLIGYLPEQPPVYPDMTVEEYLNFTYDLKGCKFERDAHISEICDVVKITDVRKRLIRNLSKGYKQRVGVAQALVGDPPVIIFDEPTVGLDPKQIIEIRSLIRTLGKNHTILLSTHILQEVAAVCDRIIIISKGRIVADEKTENITRVVENNRRFNVKVCGPQKEVLQTIKEIPGVNVCGPQCLENRVGVISLDFVGQDNAEVAYQLETEYGILTRCGLHCAPSAHKTLDTFPRGTVRFSLGFASTEDDVDGALRAIAAICAG